MSQIHGFRDGEKKLVFFHMKIIHVQYVSHSISTRDSNIDHGLCMNCDTYFAMNYSLCIKQAK